MFRAHGDFGIDARDHQHRATKSFSVVRLHQGRHEAGCAIVCCVPDFQTPRTTSEKGGRGAQEMRAIKETDRQGYL